jgi:phospholipid N-methyltransferase
MRTLIYLKTMISDRYVASVTPSSHFAVQSICNRIDFSRDNLIIEYGPGTGNFTTDLLNQMSGKSRLIAVERNRHFYDILRREISDPRLSLYNDCASNLSRILGNNGHGCADYIISGIPFSLISAELKQTILLDTYSALKKGGKFLTYQTFYQPPGHLRTHLRNRFYSLKTNYVLRCVPPLTICEAVK